MLKMLRQIVFSILILILLESMASCSVIDDLLAEIPKDTFNISTPLTQCEEQLIELTKAADKQHSWALKALDASPGDLNNFMLGQNHWLGNAATCRAVNEPILMDFTDQQTELLKQTAPFDFEYHVAYIQANSPWQLIAKPQKYRLLHIGLCLPKTCQIKQVEKLLNNSLAHGETWQKFEMQPKLMYIKIPKLNQDFYESGIWKLFLMIMTVNGILIIIPTLGFAEKNHLLQCFNIRTNWKRLFDEPQPDKENSMINGLRLLSAFLLMAMHVVFFKYFSVDSSLEMGEKVVHMIMKRSYLPFMMEFFFSISGFLTVTNFLSNEKEQQNISQDNLINNILRFSRQVLHRYLRLMPLQFVVLVIAILIGTYLRQVSVFHIIEPADEYCQQYWWRNALFIQNLFPISDMCCNWTWSLGCDMQFYVAALFILFIHTRHPKLIRSLSLIFIITNAIYTWLPMRNVKNNFEDFYGQADFFYINPNVRILGYAIGCFYGYWYSNQMPMSPYNYVFNNIWRKLAFTSVIVAMFIRFEYWDLPSTKILVATTILLRFLMAALTGEIILRNSNTDLAKSWNWILNLLRAGWIQKASRVTYAIYLLNPVVILTCYYMQSQSLAMDNSIMILLIAGYTIIVYILAIIFTVLIEMPYNRLSNLLLNRSLKAKVT